MKRIIIYALSLLTIFWLLLWSSYGNGGGDIMAHIVTVFLAIVCFIISLIKVKDNTIRIQIGIGLLVGIIANIFSLNLFQSYKEKEFLKQNPYYLGPYSSADSSSFQTDKELKSFNENDFNFKKIEYLSLNFNDVRTLPSFFKKFEKLEQLNLATNQNLQIDSVMETISAIQTLKVLDLTNCNLNHIPTSIKKLKHLERLDISMNPKLDIDSVKEMVSDMETLKTINW